jgi:two-component sensor histidine kinase
MAQSPQTKRRPVGAAVLAIPLLALLVLAGVGTAVSLREGARAERVRELVPFTAALTTLVHDLQQERSLSATRVAAAGQEAGVAGAALEAGQGAGEAAAALDTARGAVDGAAAGYRDAAVRLDISDRDRGLHQRLDAGLTELAGLTALRAMVDNPATRDPAAASATVFRRYTAIVGDLLAVDGEIGLREADQDAGLLRAVTAASAFARAGELADRERVAAARAAATGHLEQADRTRLAALGGRQDALVDQFRSLASPGQLRRYAQAMPAAETERIERLRRAALEGGPGADLAAWSGTATTRSGRMRQVERSLTAEVARLATLADRDADRRAIAYGGVLLLTACTVAVLLVLAPGRARRSRRQGAVPETRHRDAVTDARTHGMPPEAPPTRSLVAVVPDPDPPILGTPDPRPPIPGPPNREGSPPGTAAGQVVHTPTPLGASPAAVPGLAYLARRSQDLADQQLELLDRTGRDQRDPRLPGRLLQIDRLAVRARRNAHNLIVLSGGEPGRQWSGPAPLAEVVAAAVSDNPDAARIDLAVGDDLLVPGAAADDLANLLAELVDNATAFSAPETRVEVRGQKVGSGYVLEVEDRGLGMTDGELETVNRRLARDPAAGGDLEQQLGTWVAGRLAERHQVRVQLRRSSYGGVTALVFFPEPLVVRAEPAGRGAPPPAGEGPGDAALASLPLRRYVTQVPEREPPLPKRAPHTSLAPDLAATGDPGRPGDPAGPAGSRSPEQVRSMLTRYRSGLERGRAAAARDLPDDPDDEPAS